MKIKYWIVVVGFLLSWPAGFAEELRFARIFSDHAVLQRQKPVPVWGRGEPGETVTVSFAGQEVSGVADDKGRWLVYLEPMEASKEGRNLTLTGSKSITLKNVLVGEVWITAGQSNMERTFALDVIDFKTESLAPEVRETYRAQFEEVSKASQPMMRIFKPNFFISFDPMDDFDPMRHSNLKWVEMSPATIRETSALPYFFAKELMEKLDVPVGMVELAVSGTPGTAWLSRKQMEEVYPGDMAKYDEWSPKMVSAGFASREDWDQKEQQWRNNWTASSPSKAWPGNDARLTTTALPSVLYNALVHPAAPYAVRGVIWHQGEGGPWKQYHLLLKALSEQWREAHGDSDICFIWGTLAGDPTKMKLDQPGLGCDLFYGTRNIESQAQANFFVEKGAGLNFVDLGNGCLHWGRKDIAGVRMATAARALCYGETGLVYNGPLFEKAVIDGDKIRVSFRFAGSGLEFRGDGIEKQAFMIAGKDRKMVPAVAVIEGSDVVISSDQVTHPDMATYCCPATLGIGLFNKEGWAAFPFRTKDVFEEIKKN